MTDILEGERDFWQSDFSTQQIVVVVLQFRVGIMIPPKTVISIELKHIEKHVRTCFRLRTASLVLS